MRARGCEASSAAVLLANCAFLLKLLLASPALLAWLLLRCWSWLTNALSKATASLARPVMAGLAEAFDAVLSEAPDGARWGGRPARPSAMQRAYDDASARMAARLRAYESAEAPRARTPSRTMMSSPSAARLDAAAADASLDRTRALMGTSWTNRLAALLPPAWTVGSCCGDDDGRAAARFEPAHLDRVECTRLRAATLRSQPGSGRLFGLELETRNDDDGLVIHAHGVGASSRPATDPNDGELSERVKVSLWGGDANEDWISERAELARGEHVVAVHGFARRTKLYGLVLELNSGRMVGRPYVDGSTRMSPVRLEAPRGLAVRGFYGRVAADHVSGLGILCGPPAPVAWSPARPERFSDLATARAAAVLALAEDPRNLRFGRLPTALVEAILACALALFDD